jgi:uncharacterized protein (DUF2267 family)
MTYEHFIGQVQNRARLPSEGHAMRAVEATLLTLAERLEDHEAKHLASQLPMALRLIVDNGEHRIRRSLHEFLECVREREKVELPTATYHARVVLEVMQEAVSPGEIEDVLCGLPVEFAPLFAGSRGAFKHAVAH